MTEVKVIDSEGSYNPVIVIQQDVGFGEQFIQLDPDKAKDVSDKIQEKLEELGC